MKTFKNLACLASWRENKKTNHRVHREKENAKIMDNSKSIKSNFNKSLLRITSIVITGAFLFNIVALDVVWADSNSYLRVPVDEGIRQEIEDRLAGNSLPPGSPVVVSIIPGELKYKYDVLVEALDEALKEGNGAKIKEIVEELGTIEAIFSQLSFLLTVAGGLKSGQFKSDSEMNEIFFAWLNSFSPLWKEYLTKELFESRARLNSLRDESSSNKKLNTDTWLMINNIYEYDVSLGDLLDYIKKEIYSMFKDSVNQLLVEIESAKNGQEIINLLLGSKVDIPENVFGVIKSESVLEHAKTLARLALISQITRDIYGEDEGRTIDRIKLVVKEFGLEGTFKNIDERKFVRSDELAAKVQKIELFSNLQNLSESYSVLVPKRDKERKVECPYPISNLHLQSILSELNRSEHETIFNSPETFRLLQPWFNQYSEENIHPEDLMKKLIMRVGLTQEIRAAEFQTAFFRYRENFKDVKGLIIKALKEKIEKDEKEMKIWSAGCSIGAEPYSLAIMLQEIFNENNELGEISDWNIKIIATDKNLYVLNFAAKGIYHQTEIEKKEKKWGFNFSVNKYFKRIPDGRYEISSEIKNMVAFEYLDLEDEKQRERMNDFDVIFCRNVYIRMWGLYLKKPIVQRLLEDLSPSVKTGGLIVCSPEDSANAPLLKSFYHSLNFDKITSTIFRKENINVAAENLQQKFSEFTKVSPDIKLLDELKEEITASLKDPTNRRALIINHRFLREPGFALGLYKIIEQLGWDEERGLRLVLSYNEAEEGETVDKFYEKIEKASGVDLSRNFFDKVVSAEEEKKPSEVINKLVQELNVKSVVAFGPGDWVKLYRDIKRPQSLKHIIGVVCELGDNNRIIQIGTAFDTALEAFLVKEGILGKEQARYLKLYNEKKDIFEITELQEVAEEHKSYIKNARDLTGAN